MVAPTNPQDGASATAPSSDKLADRRAGHRRFIVLRDQDGSRKAIARSAVVAVSETEEGCSILLLPGGRMVPVDESLDVIVDLLA